MEIELMHSALGIPAPALCSQISLRMLSFHGNRAHALFSRISLPEHSALRYPSSCTLLSDIPAHACCSRISLQMHSAHKSTVPLHELCAHFFLSTHARRSRYLCACDLFTDIPAHALCSPTSLRLHFTLGTFELALCTLRATPAHVRGYRELCCRYNCARVILPYPGVWGPEF
jgi:hypothetical protein